MHTLINPQLREVPQEIRNQVIQSQLLIRKIEWNEEEIIDLILAINAETKETIANALGLLGKYAPMLKGLSKIQ